MSCTPWSNEKERADYYENLYKEQFAEIERLRSQVNRLKQYDEERDIRLHARLTETARAEAIKAFAGRLKEKLQLNRVVMGCNCAIVEAVQIDNLIKEMTGENNGN